MASGTVAAHRLHGGVSKRTSKHPSTTFCLIVSWLIVLQLIGVFYFTVGFFLTRLEVDEESSCTENPSPLLDGSGDPAHGCWMESRYKRAVILLVDALRWDFIRWNDDVTPGEEQPWENKMANVNKCLDEDAEHCMMYKFMADPPTVTMQRLKGLTTGSMPTFLDVGNNFNSPAIEEDTWVRQLMNNDKRVRFVGDDTWINLFPSGWKEMHPFPSFNVRDIHTVDNGVIQHLFPALDTREDWDVLIGHFLGVDHIGHTWGSNHETMPVKLRQIDDVLARVMEELRDDPDTLLIVFGDHGMTPDGNHGGATELEVSSALFMYNSGPLNQGAPEMVGGGVPQPESMIVQQVDVVPTISMLLGVPIPHNSLGGIIPHMFFYRDDAGEAPPVAGEHGSEEWRANFRAMLTQLERVTRASHINAHQVHQYLLKYNKLASFDHKAIQHLQDVIGMADASYKNILGVTVDDLGRGEGVADLERYVSSAWAAYEKYRTYFDNSLEMCRSLWTQFDYAKMTYGLALLGATALSLCVELLLPSQSVESASAVMPYAPPQDPLRAIVAGAVLGGGLWGMAAALHVVGLLGVLGGTWEWAPPLVVSAALGSSAGHLFSRVSWMARHGGAMGKMLRSCQTTTVAGAAVLLLHACSFFSTSFIEGEERIVYHLLATILIVIVREVWRNGLMPTHGVYALIMLVGLRASIMAPVTIRDPVVEPEMRTLTEHVFAAYANAELFLSIGYTLATLFLVQRTFVRLHKRTKNVPMYTSYVSGGALCLHWFIEGMVDTSAWPSVLRTALPRLIYLTAAWSMGKALREAVAGRLKSQGEVMSVLGLVSFLTLGPVLMLLLGKRSASLFGISYLCGYCVIHLCGSLAAATKRNKPDWIAAVAMWSLWGVHLFFASGHRKQFETLHIQAGFVGFEEMILPVAASLVVINTFAGPILVAVSLSHVVTYTTWIASAQDPGRERAELRKGWRKVVLLMLFPNCLMIACSALSVSMHCRHLMVWTVFAPKFCFDAVLIIIVELVVLALVGVVWRSTRTQHSSK